MRGIQRVDKAGAKTVGIVEGAVVAKVATHRSTYDAALAPIAKGLTLSALLDADRAGAVEDYDAIIAEKHIRLPIKHPEPARCLLTGAGPTHIGSAASGSCWPTSSLTTSWSRITICGSPIPSCVCPPSVRNFCSTSRSARSTASMEAREPPTRTRLLPRGDAALGRHGENGQWI